MYCEGMSISSISRALQVKVGTIYVWIKKKALWALKIVERRKEELKDQTVDEITLDEMWTYVGARKGDKRNSIWIWTAVLDGKKMIFEVGDRSEETFLRLYDQMPSAKRYYTDGYEVYNWLPYNRHEVDKFGKVNRNEGKHSILRDRLKRLARRTKGYSKSREMLIASLALVCLYLGWI